MRGTHQPRSLTQLAVHYTHICFLYTRHGDHMGVDTLHHCLLLLLQLLLLLLHLLLLLLLQLY